METVLCAAGNQCDFVPSVYEEKEKEKQKFTNS